MDHADAPPPEWIPHDPRACGAPMPIMLPYLCPVTFDELPDGMDVQQCIHEYAQTFIRWARTVCAPEWTPPRWGDVDEALESFACTLAYAALQAPSEADHERMYRNVRWQFQELHQVRATDSLCRVEIFSLYCPPAGDVSSTVLRLTHTLLPTRDSHSGWVEYVDWVCGRAAHLRPRGCAFSFAPRRLRPTDVSALGRALHRR